MGLEEYTKFANENPVGYVATIEGDQPRVRAFLMWFADETGFYFHTGGPKNICQQLRQNPKAEICFVSPPPTFERMMRVSGEVEFLDDVALKACLLEQRPFLKMVVNGPDDPKLVIFRIAHGVASFWTVEDNLKEDEAPRLEF